MLIEKITEGKGINAKYDSSNILKSIYDTESDVLYIIFNKGGMYMYFPVDNETYNEFESAESQGKYFIAKIKNNPKIKFSKVTKLKEFEIDNNK